MMIDVEGIVLPNKALSNIEIDNTVKQLNIPKFRGCFCRDMLPKQPYRQECGILNLDDSNGSGTHWTAFFKDNDEKYYFDSYGLQPPDELVKYLRSPIQYNSDRIQPCNTVVYGHLCLYVLKRLSMASEVSREKFQEILNSLI
jgi:hypothetical protein